MAETLTEAMAMLERNIHQLESDTKWACGEIERLRQANFDLLHEIKEQRRENDKLYALNTELSLKNDNLLFWIRSKIQAVVN